MSALKVGDEIWRFDANHRVYEKDARGQSTGGPIYSKHFIPEIIENETKTHWVIGTGYGEKKVNKKTMRTAQGRYGAWQFYTAEEKEDQIWANQHSYKIRDQLYRATIEQLRRVAEIIGYTP